MKCSQIKSIKCTQSDHTISEIGGSLLSAVQTQPPERPDFWPPGMAQWISSGHIRSASIKAISSRSGREFHSAATFNQCWEIPMKIACPKAFSELCSLCASTHTRTYAATHNHTNIRMHILHICIRVCAFK